MDVLTLYEGLPLAGEVVHKGGGEYCGPCPSCGGRDRFILWPEHQSGAKGGRFLCRGCGAQGDAVEFLRVFRGMGYREACEALRIEPSCRNGPPLERHTAKEWTPEAERLPSAGWMGQAARFVAACASGIGSGPGHGCLLSRGLTVETARALCIGWNPADRYDRRTDWRLGDEVNTDTGRPRKVWLPKGLVLPIRRKSGVVAVLIRRADWKAEDELPKYWQVKGSGSGCYCLGAAGKPVVVVESVLDAVLVWQEAGDVAAAVALTGATKKPDAGTAAFLRAAPLLLWSLDFDEAGTKAWAWWREHFQAVKCPPLVGKDPSDMWQAGVPIRLWVEAGIAEAGKDARQGEALPLPGIPETPQNAPCATDRTKDEPKAAPAHRGKSEPRDTPPKGVDSPDSLHRLVGEDTNIAALVNWGLSPHLETGELVIDGMDALDAESRPGLERWLAHAGPGGEPRRERVARALRTGRRAAC